MLTDKIKELELAKAKMQELEQKILQERPLELASLPAKYGFASVNDFIKAVKEAVESSGSRRKAGRKAASPAPKKAKEKTRTRARITDEVRAKVEEMAKAGSTGAQIAAALGISLPSVQNIKKAAGLVNARAPKEAVVEENAAPTL